MSEETFKKANVLINQIKIVKNTIKLLENNPTGLHVYKQGVYADEKVDVWIEGDLRDAILEYYRKKLAGLEKEFEEL